MPTPLVTRRTSESDGITSPVLRLVAELEGGPFYTVSQASAITGVSVVTLRRWARSNKTRAPSKQTWLGQLKIYLYTQEDIREIRQRLQQRRVIEDRDQAKTSSRTR